LLATLLYCLALLCTGSLVLAGELGDSDSVVLELAGGEDESQGEVLLHGHPVCSVGWDERDATVACRMLGYKFGLPTRHSVFGTSDQDYVMTNHSCVGTEDSLLNCSHSLVGGGCEDKMKSAGVICQNTDKSPVELRGGSIPSEGNVYVNGAPVCVLDWGEKEAAVVCRMLGYPISFATVDSVFGPVPSTSFLGWVRCTGAEESLLDCEYSRRTECSDGKGSGVICQAAPDISIQLVGGSKPGEGNVVVNGVPVCQEGWDARDARVVCRMLGFPFGFPTKWAKYGAVPDAHLSMRDVNCNGTEAVLDFCSAKFSTKNCYRRMYAGVECLDYDYAANATVELVDSMHRKDLKSLAQGNVMINNQHIILGFGREEAMVTCRMMGYYCHVKHGHDDIIEA